MKTVGVIGGIGPESTIEYYRFLISEYRSRVADGSYPSVLIDSIVLAKTLRTGRLRERQQVEAIILGGTELPLILLIPSDWQSREPARRPSPPGALRAPVLLSLTG